MVVSAHLVFLIDTSAVANAAYYLSRFRDLSGPAYVDEVSQALMATKTELEQALDLLDLSVSVITYGASSVVRVPAVPIQRFVPPDLQPSGDGEVRSALQLVAEIVSDCEQPSDLRPLVIWIYFSEPPDRYIDTWVSLRGDMDFLAVGDANPELSIARNLTGWMGWDAAIPIERLAGTVANYYRASLGLEEFDVNLRSLFPRPPKLPPREDLELLGFDW